MPENLVDEKQRSDQKPAPTAPPANRRRTSRVLILLLLMLVICVAMIVGYRQGVVQTALRHAQSMYLLSKGDRVLTKTTQENLVSPGSASGVVGKSAVDVSPVLSVEPVQATSRPTESKPETPGPGEEESVPEKPLPGEQPAQPTVAVGPVATVSGTKAPKIVETPVIVPRQPPEESKPEPTEPSRVGAAPTETKEQTAEIEREKKEPKETKRRGPVAHPAEKTKRVGARSALGATASVQKPEAKVEASGVKEDSASRGDDKGKGERFQLPGSLLVSIKNHEGSLTKWAIMVILDDSQSMGRKSRLWSPNRFQAAETLVSKLPEIITPGSRIAVRDFLCKQSSEKEKGGPCLSHLLYEWSGAPFQNLQAKLDKVDAGGQTDPCAAAAHSIKKDLSEQVELVPRVLVVTNGAAKCKVQDVTKAVDGYRGKDKVRVDVVALGMNKRTQRGYTTMAQKANGVLLKVNAPSDIDQVLAAYKKILQKKSMEKVEIRAENAVFTGNLGDEIALSPGTYSVVLPLVAGLKAANRTIPNVKVLSGEATLVHVKIAKGRVTVRIAKK